MGLTKAPYSGVAIAKYGAFFVLEGHSIRLLGGAANLYESFAAKAPNHERASTD